MDPIADNQAFIDAAKNGKPEIAKHLVENNLYNNALNSVEKLSMESKIRLIQKLIKDGELFGEVNISYCSCCKTMFQENCSVPHSAYSCKKCGISYCDDCLGCTGNKRVAVICDRCECFHCKNCAEGETVEKMGRYSGKEYFCTGCVPNEKD
jgi:hypothetical protein